MQGRPVLLSTFNETGTARQLFADGTSAVRTSREQTIPASVAWQTVGARPPDSPGVRPALHGHAVV